MGRTYEKIDDRLAGWMQAQPVFFVATAPLAADGHINCSPKGNRRELVVLDPHRVAYLDQTGSGVETIAHLQENGRIVLMFCAFDGPPRIVRVHGKGRAVRRDDPEFPEVVGRIPPMDETGVETGPGAGARSVIVVEAQRISDSCGYGVPLMDFERHRPTMDEWVERKGADGIRAYWKEKNGTSLDGLPGIPS